MIDPKTKLKSNALEIVMLKQAIVAQRIREQLEAEPQGAWHGLNHNHLCPYCDTTWRCDCDDPGYEVKDHGCDEQAAASQRLAVALSMPDRWEAPYLSRRAKPKRAASGERQSRAETQIMANNAEIAKLRAVLGISA